VSLAAAAPAPAPWEVPMMESTAADTRTRRVADVKTRRLPPAEGSRAPPLLLRRNESALTRSTGLAATCIQQGPRKRAAAG
jgi:hypothetical protein